MQAVLEQKISLEGVNTQFFLGTAQDFILKLNKLEEILNDVDQYNKVTNDKIEAIAAINRAAWEDCKTAMYTLNLHAVMEDIGILEYDSIAQLQPEEFIQKLESAIDNLPANDKRVEMLEVGLKAVYELQRNTAKFNNANSAGFAKTNLCGLAFAFVGGIIVASVFAALSAVVGFAATMGTANGAMLGAGLGACYGFVHKFQDIYKTGAGSVNEVAQTKYSLLRTINKTQDMTRKLKLSIEADEEIKNKNTPETAGPLFKA